MPSSWDIYYVVFLSAWVSLSIPLVLSLLSSLVAPRGNRLREPMRKPPAKLNVEKANHTLLGQRINVRFFLAANSALILLTLALILVPAVGAFQTGGKEGAGRGLIAIVTVAGFAALGLLYSARKGDLGWLGTLNKTERP